MSTLPELQTGAVQAMKAGGPVESGVGGVVTFIGRGLAFLLKQPREQILALGLEGAITLLENAFQVVVVDVNFANIPDFIEDPIEAWAKSQIRPTVTSLLGPLFSTGS